MGNHTRHDHLTLILPLTISGVLAEDDFTHALTILFSYAPYAIAPHRFRPLLAAAIVTVHARVSGRKNDGTEAAGYVLAATYRRAGGTTTQVGTTTALATHEDSSGWDATLDASGTGVRVRVTGAGSTTVDWACNGTVTIVP